MISFTIPEWLLRLFFAPMLNEVQTRAEVHGQASSQREFLAGAVKVQVKATIRG